MIVWFYLDPLLSLPLNSDVVKCIRAYQHISISSSQHISILQHFELNTVSLLLMCNRRSSWHFKEVWEVAISLLHRNSGKLSFDIQLHLTFNYIWHLTFDYIWHLITFELPSLLQESPPPVSSALNFPTMTLKGGFRKMS